MAEKRLTKHELKEDLLVTGAFRARTYLAENREKFLWGAGGLLFLILAGIWFFNQKAESSKKGDSLLTRANLELQVGQIPLALQDLRQLVEKHSGAKAGKEGAYYLANVYFMSEDYNQAEQYYRKYLDASAGNQLLAGSASAGLGVCYEKKGKTKEAAEAFMQAVKLSRDNFQTPDYLVGAIRNYSALGDSAKARELLARLRKDFPVYREQPNQALLYMGRYGIFERPEKTAD
jgi:tetratricopeptide (TPR) repeat protein